MKFPEFIRIQEGDFREAGSWFRRLALLLNRVLEDHDRALRSLTIPDNFAGQIVVAEAPFPLRVRWEGRNPPRSAFLYYVEGPQPTQQPWPLWRMDGQDILITGVNNLPAGAKAHFKFY